MVFDGGPDEPNEEGSGGIFGGRPPLPIIGGALAAVVVGLILVVVVLGGGGGDDGTNADALATFTPAPGVSGGLAQGLPTPVGTLGPKATVTAVPNPTDVGPDDRIVIEKFGINAPLTYRKVPPNGVMPNPEGPDDVAFYDFSEFPGFGGMPGVAGNPVFAGHVDSGSEPCENGTVPPPCQAVFWDIGKLTLGDIIEIHLGGQVIKYEVTSNQAVDAETGPWEEIVAADAEQETITLITCGGDFNPQTRSYSHRQVVTGVRILDNA